jgi:hypothetical protein
MSSFISLILLFMHVVSCTQPLDDKALEAIGIGKQQILAATSEKDLLVFLGNSASYFYHAVSEQRVSYRIPISGRYVIDALDRKERNRFEEVFISPIVNEALKDDRKIILIDHSHTGQSVDSFNSLLRNYCHECRASFINLVTHTQVKDALSSKKPWIHPPKTIALHSYVVLPDVAVKLFNDGYVRLSPHHPHWKWEKSTSTLLQEYQKQPKVLEAIEKLGTRILPAHSGLP